MLFSMLELWVIHHLRQVWSQTICVVSMVICLVSPLAAAGSIAEIEQQFEAYLLQDLEKAQSDPSKLRLFTTDGCSGGMSDGWDSLAQAVPTFKDEYGEQPPWEACCVEHDKAYWRGEVIDGFNKRKAADEALKQCVIEAGDKLKAQMATELDVSEESMIDGFKVAAELMYVAVRLGGRPCTSFPWRWGYGWPQCPNNWPARPSGVK